jgi:serine/threonine-protein kinase RsbW
VLTAPQPSAPNGARTTRLEINSVLETLDLVDTVTDLIGRAAGLDEEALHWFGMAVHECVINAIIHGNHRDSKKSVSIEFRTTSTELAVSVRDEGNGFDPDRVPDPCAGENTLRTHGRGIYLIRQIMDDVSIQPTDRGGMEVQMTKRL